MRRSFALQSTCLAVIAMGAVTVMAERGSAARQTVRPASARTAPRAAAPARAAIGPAKVIGEYCLTCHDDDHQKGGLSLEKYDPARADLNAETTEKIIHKLRAGLMPPAGADRPEPAVAAAMAAELESIVDRAAALRPNPGRRSFQRLNRAEYARSIKDLLSLDVDVTAFLPADTISHNFDNIADVQSFSPTLLEGYLRAASRISRDAVGDPSAAPGSTTYRIPRTASQLDHVDGAPFGTRGGISVVHNFPADGEYSFRMMLHSIPTGQLYGSTTRGEQIDVSINGQRVALVDINPRMSESDPNGMNLQTPPVAVKAGPQRVSAAFVARGEGPFDDLLQPIEYTLADTQIGSAIGVTTFPHLRDFAIVGPQKVTGVSETPSRRRIFTCRPLTAGEEASCAAKIVADLARQAYRRPLGDEDMKGLLGFYERGRREGDFESGIRTALQAILASPHFIFRLEEAPAGVRAGQNYRLNDLDLASRLSFFLWASPPDAPLVQSAARGALHNPLALDREVRRMLADPRAAALATRFAGLWLRLQDVDKIHPDALLYPHYDQTLGDAMQRETELLFESVVREDRNVLELLTADYTFVNERLAKHYGLPDVTGEAFRRVHITDENRRGLLGQGSILTMTSVADRTSPVQRGKWVLEVLLGSPPPPPPPNVPDLAETKAAEGARLLTVRERMEAHRANPQCRSCHRMMDPVGLALENFDVTGAWRIKDNGTPIDAAGELYDGTPLNGPVALRQALLGKKDTILRTFTSNLMAYALGRRVEYYDQPAVRAIVRDAGAANHRFSSFVLGIVKSAAFQMSRAEATH
jgi:mono/diheme cytochrome c family protein